MSQKIKQIVRIIANPMRPAFRRACVTLIQWMNEDLQQINSELHAIQTDRLLDGLQSCGAYVTIGRGSQVTCPRMLSLGNNVHIGNNAILDTRGGLTVGDHTHIGPNCIVQSIQLNTEGRVLPYDDTFTLRPVWIGRNVYVGSDVRILPGVTIGDGAVIGSGVTVTTEVAPLAVLEATPPRQAAARKPEHYETLVARNRYGDRNGAALNSAALAQFRKNALEKGREVFFGVSTGRSGSTTLADALTQHSAITCLHEPRWNLIPISAAYEHGTMTRQEVATILRRLYCESGWLPEGVYGESDLKLANLVELLAELLPEAKFIWLIRDGRDVVSSFLARRQYDPGLHDLSVDHDGPDERNHWDRNVIDGALCGDVTPAVWDIMTPFEKNCWYWYYWNNRIERQFASIAPGRCLFVRLEELQQDIIRVQEFLGVSRSSIAVPCSNRVRSQDQQRLQPWEKWSAAQKQAFERWCGPGMDRWYPGWRGVATDPFPASRSAIATLADC